MTDHAGLLRQIRVDARPYVEQALDLAEVFTGFRKLASENGLDWGVIKALIKAEVQDEKEGGSLKVDKIIEKADFASEDRMTTPVSSMELKPIETAPKDGTIVYLPVNTRARAFWCNEMKVWVLTRQWVLDTISNPEGWQPTEPPLRDKGVDASPSTAYRHGKG